MTSLRSPRSAGGTSSPWSTSERFGPAAARSSVAPDSPLFALDASSASRPRSAEPKNALTPGHIGLGVYPAGFPVNRDALTRYTAVAGRPPAIVHYFRNWGRDQAFDPAAAQLVHEVGAVPMISWQPTAGLEPIANGEWDDYLAAYAPAVAAYGHPLLLRFAHEMNLPQIPWFGPAATFLAAWRRVHGAFAAAGAQNVQWVWSPYVNARGVADLSSYFPGEALVDWPALDGYNWGRRRRWQRWPSFDHLFAPSLAMLDQLMPGAPVMLAEIGCAPRGGDKAGWMRDALLHAIAERHRQIRAVVWFDEDKRGHADWRIDSSAESLAVWREAVADRRFSLSAAELVKLPAG